MKSLRVREQNSSLLVAELANELDAHKKLNTSKATLDM
jgi:hypothetical protein